MESLARFVLDATPEAPDTARDVAGAMLPHVLAGAAYAEGTPETAKVIVKTLVSIASRNDRVVTCELKRDTEHLYLSVEGARNGDPPPPEDMELLRALAQSFGTHGTVTGTQVMWAALPLSEPPSPN